MEKKDVFVPREALDRQEHFMARVARMNDLYRAETGRQRAK